MKIAFLTPEYPHERTGSSGGIGTSIKNLGESLVDLGHTVRVLVYGQAQDAIFTDHLITIQQIKNVKLKGFSRFLTQHKIEKIIDTLHDNGDLDIVEAADWTGITSFISPKSCPIVIRLNGSDTYFCHLDNRPVKWINQFHEMRALKKADGHISVSQFTANLTNQLFRTHIPFEIIPNGIDIKQFNSVSDSEHHPNSILYFGTLIRKKGLLDLPHIFNKVVEKHPNAQLYLVGKDASDIISGEPSTWEMMKRLFSPAALANVHYLGSVPYQEVKQHIMEATVCVFPSYAEALPVSWLEAMAMQKAIVASNVGWANEMITNNREGILVHPSDHQKYAEAIVDLLNNAPLRVEMGSSASEKIQIQFENTVVANQTVKYYNSLLSKK